MAIEKGNNNAMNNLKVYMNSILLYNDDKIIELLDLSNKINDFEIFNKINETKIFALFCNLENIDKIYSYLDKLIISDTLKQSYLLSVDIKFNQLPNELKKIICTKY